MSWKVYASLCLIVAYWRRGGIELLQTDWVTKCVWLSDSVTMVSHKRPILLTISIIIITIIIMEMIFCVSLLIWKFIACIHLQSCNDDRNVHPTICIVHRRCSVSNQFSVIKPSNGFNEITAILTDKKHCSYFTFLSVCVNVLNAMEKGGYCPSYWDICQ